jgi:hypothetical protein
LPGLVALGWYSHARWGSVTTSGYEAVTGGFWNESILTGLWGQLLSPGKSLFLFSPPLVLALWGWRRLIARRAPVALAVALTVGPVALIYARYLFWSGDWGWGPRYLVFALPALLLPAAELFPDEPAPPGRALRAGLLAALLAGVAAQGLGNAFAWRDFIRISRQAQEAWLGRPATAGNVLAPYECFSCFEQMYPIQWLPPMQPMAGHWWLLRHKIRGDDWKAAAADAPWSRYTSLAIDIRSGYDGARVDWLPLEAGPRAAALAALALLLLLLAVPVRPWLAALRWRGDGDGQQREPGG